MPILSLGGEDPLEEEMATHSSILAWRIPGSGTKEPGRLWSMVLKRVRYDLQIKQRNYMLSSFSHVRLCDPMDCSPPGSSVRGIFQEEYWNELPFPPPGDLPDPVIEPASPVLASGFFTTESTWKRRSTC